MLPRLLIAVLGICIAFGPISAGAELNDAALSEKDIEQRVHFIEDRLDAHKLHGEIWYWSWMTINTGSAVGLGIAAGLTEDGSDRVSYASQAFLGALGVADLVFQPLKARYGADPIRNLPNSTHEEKLAKLHAAEDLLRSNAKRAAQRKDWFLHFMNFLLNGAAGAATGLAGDSGLGALNAGIGFLSGEIYIMSQPAGPKKDWEQYRERFSKRTSQQGPRLFVQARGLGMTVGFKW